MSELALKAEVRERDGSKCCDCGMTTEEHFEKYDQKLHVHRNVPGSVYSADGCDTVCKRCHGRRHREINAANRPPIKMAIDTEEKIRLAVKLASTKAGLSPSELINNMLRKQLAKEITDAERYTPRRRDDEDES